MCYFDDSKADFIRIYEYHYIGKICKAMSVIIYEILR